MFPSQFCLLDYVETLAVGACPCRRRVDQRVVLICDADAAEGEPQAARRGAFHPSCFVWMMRLILLALAAELRLLPMAARTS
jgi:hypothetical protein